MREAVFDGQIAGERDQKMPQRDTEPRLGPVLRAQKRRQQCSGRAVDRLVDQTPPPLAGRATDAHVQARDQLARRAAQFDEWDEYTAAGGEPEQGDQVGWEPLLVALSVEARRQTADHHRRRHRLTGFDSRPALLVVGEWLDEAELPFAPERDEGVSLLVGQLVVDARVAADQLIGARLPSAGRMVMQLLRHGKKVGREIEERDSPITRL